MADTAERSERTSLLSPETMGTFDAEGNYTPRTIVDDDLGDADLEQAMGDSIISFDDGDVIEGTVVKIDRDEVLLDIGFKSEGVIPARELSIRNDVDPSEIVSIGDRIECLVLLKEDKEGRLVLSKKRAQYEKAWSNIEELKNRDEVVKGVVIEVVKGGDEIAHRLGDVWLEVAAPDHAFLGVEIDQDQRPVGERCDARYDGSLELEHNWTGPNALERQQLKAHPTTSPGHACMTTA